MGLIYDMNRTNVPKELQIHSWSKEIKDLGRIPWDGKKTEGESDTSVLRELISPNNSKIPWRNQEIANGGLGVTVMVVLEKRRVKMSEWVSSVGGDLKRKNRTVRFYLNRQNFAPWMIKLLNDFWIFHWAPDFKINEDECNTPIVEWWALIRIMSKDSRWSDNSRVHTYKP
jgi:hypothetical protein